MKMTRNFPLPPHSNARCFTNPTEPMFIEKYDENDQKQNFPLPPSFQCTVDPPLIQAMPGFWELLDRHPIPYRNYVRQGGSNFCAWKCYI